MPRDEGLRRRVGDIEVNGARGTVSCISMSTGTEAASITVLGRLPGELPAPLTLAALRALCNPTP